MYTVMRNRLNQIRRGKHTLSYETSKSFTHRKKYWQGIWESEAK